MFIANSTAWYILRIKITFSLNTNAYLKSVRVSLHLHTPVNHKPDSSKALFCCKVGRVLFILQAFWWMDVGGSAWLNTPQPYVSTQSVSLAPNGTSATPVSQATSAPTALATVPSFCINDKASMLISLPRTWAHLTLSGLVDAPWIDFFLFNNGMKDLNGKQAVGSHMIIRIWHCSGNDILRLNV